MGKLRNEAAALAYLQLSCVQQSSDRQGLLKQWQDAKKQLGAPVTKNAGIPDIRTVGDEHGEYLGRLKTIKEYTPSFAGKNWSFQFVEIRPLLAFQPHVMEAQIAKHCGALSAHPSEAEIVRMCIPQQPPVYQLSPITDPTKGIVVKCPDLDVIIGERGMIKLSPNLPNVAGVIFSAVLPFVEVARFNGRCYLKNGYHRACGLQRLGIKHMPCVLRDVTDYAETGAQNNSVFERGILEDRTDPPTIGHFAEGRPWPVMLRRMAKIIHVLWSEQIVPDE